ncbi:hypothetical protein [Streptomyces sp. NPDC101166]|uniref:hypothetical protein n=1 Tax=Streptomyces sp. NPDC101166 TaxID=3366120 RepID=UPI00382216EC
MRLALRTVLATAVVAGAVLTPFAGAQAAIAVGAPNTSAAVARGVAFGNPEGELILTERLADGLTGKVYRKAQGVFTAVILRDETVLGTLHIDKASGKEYVGGRFGATAVALWADGNISGVLAKDDGDDLGPLFKSFDLTDGYEGFVYKNREAYTALIRRAGVDYRRLSVDKSKGKTSDKGVYGGMTVWLSQDGRLVSTGAPVPPGKCTVSRDQFIGAGTVATLVMSPGGPKATFWDAGSKEPVLGYLDRAHPQLPTSAGIIARLVNPYTYTPSLYTKVEGGGAKGTTTAFPALPKGCKLAPVAGSTNGGGRTSGTQTHQRVPYKSGTTAGH